MLFLLGVLGPFCYICSVVHFPSFVLQVPYTIVRYPFYMENFFKITPPEKQDDGSFAISKGLFTSMKNKRESESDFALGMGFESIFKQIEPISIFAFFLSQCKWTVFYPTF